MSLGFGSPAWAWIPDWGTPFPPLIFIQEVAQPPTSAGVAHLLLCREHEKHP